MTKKEAKVEVLFEYFNYRSIICCKNDDICQQVERHLEIAGPRLEEPSDRPRVVVLSESSKSRSSKIHEFFLQKWVPKWGCFVNVDSLREITADDRLTVVARSSSKSHTEITASEVAKLTSAVIGCRLT